MTTERRPLAILRDDEEDPITSVVNLIDVFLVIIAVLLMVIIQNPLNPLTSDSVVVVVKNPGKENMEMIVKEGETLKHYTSSGEMGEGEGVKAGITYKLQDGTMVYVPEG